MSGTNNYNENEIETRISRIDPVLKKVGWVLFKNMRYEYPISAGRIDIKENRRGKEKTADYVLFSYPHQPIAVIEAKKSSRSETDGMQQAIEYAERLNVPFIFCTNGKEFIFRNEYITEGRFPKLSFLFRYFFDGTKIIQFTQF